MGKTDLSSPLKAQKKHNLKSEKIWYISSKKYILRTFQTLSKKKRYATDGDI